jgi:TPR repeat protein
MYAGGQGVEQSYSEAAQWYQKAAEQGVSEAQYRLGNLYKNGEGVPQDAETAYGWYRVAAHLGNSKSAAAVKDVSGLLSEEEMTGAAKLSEELIAKYGKVPKTTSHSQ